MVRNIHQEELSAIRERALALHTRLLAEARSEYENKEQRTLGPGEMLQVVAFGKDFEWLRPLTRLIVDLDITLEREAPLTDEDVVAARLQLDALGRGAVA